MKTHRILLPLIIALALPMAANAIQKTAENAKKTTNSMQKTSKNDAKTADMARVEAYLSGLSTITADFTQVDANGGLSGGKFYLKRPGKMRWQYAPPTPILLLSDGKVVVYYDSELDQVSYVGIDDTLASFLARGQVALNNESTKMTEFSAKNGVIRFTVIQAKKPTEGSLTLEFSDNPLLLKQMIVTDAAGNSTTIRLQNIKYGDNLPDSLFHFTDPRGPGSHHRR